MMRPSDAARPESVSVAPESVSVVVEIPAGLEEGDEMVVAFGNDQFVVYVPPDCAAGSEIEVSLPSRDARPSSEQPEAPLSFIDVELPPSSKAGDALTVDTSTGPITFIVPEGAGSSVRIDLPASQTPGETKNRTQPDDEQDDGPASPGLPPIASEFCLPYWVGLDVEVYRSDGTRTFGMIQQSDYASGTYTLEMADGRCAEPLTRTLLPLLASPRVSFSLLSPLHPTPPLTPASNTSSRRRTCRTSVQGSTTRATRSSRRSKGESARRGWRITTMTTGLTPCGCKTARRSRSSLTTRFARHEHAIA